MVEKKLQSYYWIITVVVGTTILLILAAIFLIVPSFKSINKISTELKEKKGDLKVLEQKLVKLKDFKVKEKELKEQSEVVYRAIPTKKEIGDVFIQLNGLITEAGGDNAKASSEKSAGSGKAKDTSVQTPAGVSTLAYNSDVTFPGYQNFKSMLASSEKALRFVHLTSFKISGQDAFKVTLKYRAYYREDGANVGKEK